MMTKFGFTVIGCFIAPLIAAAIAVGLTAVKQDSNYFSLLGLFPIFYFYAFAAMILLGLPIFYILLHFNLISWWTAILAGSLVGVVIAVVLRMPSTVNVGDMIALSAIGAISGFSFWLIMHLGQNTGHP